VASRNQEQTHSDATGLNCGDRSWICNVPLICKTLFIILKRNENQNFAEEYEITHDAIKAIIYLKSI